MTAVPLILRLDVTGKAISWAPWQEAICLYANDKVLWTVGQEEFTFHGGFSRINGKQSKVEVNSIIAVRGTVKHIDYYKTVPPLSNRELFLRDEHMCLYCGSQLPSRLLTRDHVTPLYRGGKTSWANIVTACRSCNARKGGKTPEEARMPLLAIPFVPNWAEYLALTNRKILADQMVFLKGQFGKNSRLHLKH